jgi:putative aldouronate transport system permease protein
VKPVYGKEGDFMKLKRTFSDLVFDIINVVLMFFLIIITLYPFLHVIFCSFSTSAHVMSHKGIMLWPKGFNIEAYRFAISHPMLGLSYLNTIYYAVAGTLLGLTIMSFAAYAFAKPQFPGKRFFLFIIVFTMFFGGGLIPTYLNIKNFGLMDTRLVMFLPSCISTWSIIIMRTGFQQLPVSLSESAYLDGANDFIILFRIILPLSKATLAVVSLFSIVGYWNSWFSALIYLKDRNKYPLQMILREILIIGEMADLEAEIADKYSSTKRAAMQEVIKYATMVLTTGPIIIAYPFLQKHFVKGVMIGSLKG